MFTKLITSARKAFARTSQYLGALAVLALGNLANAQTATTFEGTYNSATGIDAGEAAVGSKLSASSSNVVGLIFGPGMWIVMAIGALIAVYGLIQKSKETLLTGIGVFLFAMVLKAIFVIAA